MADSGREALALLKQQPADVVLADWTMEGMDGIELTEAIRQRDEEQGIYTAIILFTAHEGMEYLVKAFEHGVDDYLCKPPNPLELAARVNAAARIADLQNDLLETSRQMGHTIKRLKNMALLDDLTGAGNQRFLMKNLKSQIQEVSSRQGGVCLALIKLDGLDDVHAQHGTEVINEILISQYRRLKRTVRPTDTIARLDNNAFAVIMHHTNVNDYKTSAMKRLLAMVNKRAYTTSAGNLNISGHMGVCYYHGDEAPITADELYAKTTEKLQNAGSNHDLSIAF